MSSPPVTIIGWSSSDRVPGVAAETVPAAGAISVSQLPVKCLITGTKLTAGTAVPNQDVVRLFSVDDADAAAGPGCESACQAYVAIAQDPNVPLYFAPAAEAGGATAGTATITVDGAWTATGNWDIQLDGLDVTNGIATTDTVQQVANAMRDTYNQDPRRPCVASVAAGSGTSYVVTYTTKSKGIRANDHSLYVNKTKLPTGMTMVLAGGTSMSSGGVKFVSGSGAEDITTLLGVLFPGTYDYIAAAQNDSTNSARWKTQINSKASPTENRIDRVIYGLNGALGAAQSLTQSASAMNDFRMQAAWLQAAEWPASLIAAAMASIRSVTEPDNPGAIYDDVVLVGCPAQRTPSDVAQHSTLASALLSGVTPLKSVNGVVTICMSVTSYSLFGALPDYRCLQTYYEVVPDTFRKDVALRFLTEIKPNNPHVADDPSSSEKERPAGIWTPTRANAWLTGILKEYEARVLLVNVDANPPSSGYDKTAHRIVSVAPNAVAAGNHQFGLSVRQLAA